MADDNVELYSLQIAADPASAQGAIAQINAVQAALAGVSTQAQALSAQMAAATQTLADTQILAADSTLGVTGALTTQATAVQDLTDLYAALDQQEKQAAADAGAGGDAGGGLSLGGARGALRAGGFLLGSQAGGQDLRAAGQIITLTSALGPAGAAAGVFALGLRAVTDWEQQATDAGKAYASNLEEIAGLIGGGATSQDIQKQIDDQKRQRDVAAESQTEIQRIYSDFLSLQKNVAYGTDEYSTNLKNLNADLYDATGGAAGLKDGLGTVSIGAQVLENALGEAQGKIDATTGKITFLGTEMGTAAVAANNLVAAQKLQTDKDLASAQQLLTAENMTYDQRQAKIQQDQVEIAAYNTMIQTVGVSADAADELGDKIGHLKNEISQLSGISQSAADIIAAVAAAEQSLTDQTTHYFDALAQEGKTRDDITALNQQLADADQEATDKSVALEADYQQKLAEIQQDGADKVAQINEDNSDKLAKIAQDNADRVAKIERNFSRDFAQSVADRDAVSAAKAEQKRQDDLDDQAQANQRALDSQQQAYDKQIEAQEKAQDKQLRSLEDSYWKQQNAIDDAFNKQRDTILRKLQQDQVDLQNVLAAEQALALNGSGGLVQIHTDLWGRLIGLSEEYAHTLTGAVAAALNSNGGGNGGIGAPLGLPVYVEQPGNPALLPPVSGTGIGSAVRSITIQVHPTDGSAATNAFLRALDEMLPDNFRGGM